MRGILAVILFLCAAETLTLAGGEHPQQNADGFVQDVLHNEIEAQIQDHSLWSYHDLKTEDGKQLLFHVFQTNVGDIDRLEAIDGRPLTPQQLHNEDRRIQRLLTHPSEMRQKQRKDREDGEQARKLLQMFPQAFRFEYAGSEGNLVRIKFTPNPKFHPSSHPEQVFHHMEGTLLLDGQQRRLAAIHGRLMSEVKFGGGLLGHLEKGGTFSVEQRELGPRCWEVTMMYVEMNGKALFFKSISVHSNDKYSDFQPLSPDTNLLQAAELLKKDTTSHTGS